MNKQSKLKFNISIFAGILLTFFVVGFTAFEATKSPLIFINYGAAVIVFGGMMTVAFIMNSFSDLVQVGRSILWLFKSDQGGKLDIITEILGLATSQQEDTFVLSQNIKNVENIYLKEGLELLSLGMKSEDIQRVFGLKMEAKYTMNVIQSGFLLSMSKMGPGLGLVGTLLAMVALFFQMGQGMGIEQIGPSMAIALCATLYGVGVSNLIFLPLAEALAHKSEVEQGHMRLISDGLIMLKERRHPVYVRESLKSYLSGTDQVALTQRNQKPKEKEEERVSA